MSALLSRIQKLEAGDGNGWRHGHRHDRDDGPCEHCPPLRVVAPNEAYDVSPCLFCGRPADVIIAIDGVDALGKLDDRQLAEFATGERSDEQPTDEQLAAIVESGRN